MVRWDYMKPGECIICLQKTSYLISKFGYPLTQCASCGLITMDPQPTSADLHSIYSNETGYHTHFSQSYIDAQTVKFRERIHTTQEILNRKDISCFDVGAANGLFLDTAKKLGCSSTSGVEMNPANATICQNNGHRVSQESIDDYIFKQKYDMIHLGDVLEHMINPKSVITKLTDALSENGIIIIALPDASGLFQKISLQLAQLLTIDWPHPLPPAHTFQFNHYNLNLLLEKNGFVEKKYSSLNTSLFAEMRDTKYFQGIYSYIKRKNGKISEFILDSFMFCLVTIIYAPFWLAGYLYYLTSHNGSYITVWYQRSGN